MNANEFPDGWNEPDITPEELTASERLEWVMRKLELGESPWPLPASGMGAQAAVPGHVLGDHASGLGHRVGGRPCP